MEDGNGSSLTFLEVDGFRYPPFPVDVIRNLPDLPIRPDDVIVCAYPKSGMTEGLLLRFSFLLDS